MVRRWWSGFGSLAAAILGLCLLPAAASGDEEEGAAMLFSVKASNGYRMLVAGEADRDDGRGEVSIFLFGRRLSRIASYETKGFVTDTRLKAKFGPLGRINLRRRSRGREGRLHAPAPCNGSTEGFEKATYHGIFRFRGEEGFTSARARRIAISPQAWVNLVCSYHPMVEKLEARIPGYGPGPEPGPGAVLDAETKRRKRVRVELEVAKSRPAGRTLATASVAEKRHGVTIYRAVQSVVGAAAFEYDSSLSTATVDLPAPFFGAAVYRRGAARRWSGNLAVDFPGRPHVRLNRPDLRTTLVPGAWSFEPPEFR